jgi:hypothetical protein
MSSSTTSNASVTPPGIPTANLDAFTDFVRQQIQNPDPITDYFRIPERLPPD